MTPGRQHVFYFGEDLAVATTFSWVMQGGAAFTLGESLKAIKVLSDTMFENPNFETLRTHSSSINIATADGKIKIVCTVEVQQGTNIQIIPPAPNRLSFHGKYYPNRPLNRGDILNVLKKWERDATFYAQHTEFVKIQTSDTYVSHEVSSEYRYRLKDYPPLWPWPQFTYLEVAALAQEVQTWYRNSGHWCVLGGDLFRSPGEETQFLQVGDFGVENKGSHSFRENSPSGEIDLSAEEDVVNLE